MNRWRSRHRFDLGLGGERTKEEREKKKKEEGRKKHPLSAKNRTVSSSRAQTKSSPSRGTWSCTGSSSGLWSTTTGFATWTPRSPNSPTFVGWTSSRLSTTNSFGCDADKAIIVISASSFKIEVSMAASSTIISTSSGSWICTGSGFNATTSTITGTPSRPASVDSCRYFRHCYPAGLVSFKFIPLGGRFNGNEIISGSIGIRDGIIGVVDSFIGYSMSLACIIGVMQFDTPSIIDCTIFSALGSGTSQNKQ